MANQQQNNVAMLAPAKVKITAKEFAAKYRSKREVYNFLAVDVGVYLPAYGKWLSKFLLIQLLQLLRASHNLFSQRPGPRNEEE